MISLRTAGIAIGASAAALLAAGCSTTGDTDTTAAATEGRTAVAELRTAANANAGTATATEEDGGVRVSVEVQGLPPGQHGAHVHTVGRCDAPDFKTAGGHWNPTSRQHGIENPAGPHAGDMPNLDVASDGTGTLTFTLPSGTFAGLLDADGSAMMIHAGPDDMKSDPSGNSGGRIACGVFRET